MDYSPAHRPLMERVIQTQQLVTLRKPLDHADEVTLETLCEEAVRFLAAAVAGRLPDRRQGLVRGGRGGAAAGVLVYGWWYAGGGKDTRGSLDAHQGVRERNFAPYPAYRRCGPGPFPFRAGEENDPCSVFQYWSHHSGGSSFAFADGSVRLLRYESDSIMPALATPAGGEVVAVPD